MTQKSILFVEDKSSQQRDFRTSVRNWNAEHPDREFVLTVCPTFSEAKSSLALTRFDCALFDLHLPAEGDRPVEAASGNELARIGLLEHGIPIGIISALPGDLDQELRRFTMIKTFNKVDEDPYRDAIDWFGSQWQMMDVLAATRRRLAGSAAEVFALRVWPRWENWNQIDGIATEDLTGIVTRQYANHIAELLGLDLGENAKWHPFENYVSPSLQPDRAHTGDLFQLYEGLWIVLSPPCDMVNRKVVNVVLANCSREKIADWDKNLEKLKNAENADQRKSRSGFFTKLVNQNVEPSLHFLPPLLEDERPIMIEFNNLRTIPLEELNGLLEARVASVSAPFLSNLTQRFGSYITRTGQPNINVEHF